MELNFVWYTLLQITMFLVIAGIAYKLYQKKKYKTAGAFAAIAIIVVFLAPPVNMTQDGYGNIERSNSTFNSQPEIPPRVTVEEELSFEERVKADLEEYENKREEDINERN